MFQANWCNLPWHPQHRADRRLAHYTFSILPSQPPRQTSWTSSIKPLRRSQRTLYSPKPRIGSGRTLSTPGSTFLPGLPTPVVRDLPAALLLKLSPLLFIQLLSLTCHCSPRALGNLSALQVSSLASYQNCSPRFSKLLPRSGAPHLREALLPDLQLLISQGSQP